MITSPCNVYPLTPHFYIVKLGFTGVYIIFSFLLKNMDCESMVKTSNVKVKEMAYKTLVRPQVEYASPVWSPHTKENIDKIEMTQRRAARWVKNKFSNYDSVTDMLSELGWR